MQKRPLRSLCASISRSCCVALVAIACTAEPSEPTGWQPAEDVCRDPALRVYSARLVRVPWWQGWQSACDGTTGEPVAGVARTPDRCVRRTPFGIWGEWDVEDPSCGADPIAAVSARGPDAREGETR